MPDKCWLLIRIPMLTKQFWIGQIAQALIRHILFYYNLDHVNQCAQVAQLDLE